MRLACSKLSRRALAAAATIALLAGGCATGRRAEAGRRGFEQSGIASWYGPGFHGRTTANGESYDMEAMTAAHKKLPFGSIVLVKNRDNGLSTTVRINDRGPFVRGRIIDLSKAAAREIGMLRPGTARVKIRVVDREERRASGATPRSYAVQAGAFKDRSRAEVRLGAVRSEAPTARIESTGGVFRVVVPNLSRSQAKATSAALKRRGIDALIRTDEK